MTPQISRRASTFQNWGEMWYQNCGLISCVVSPQASLLCCLEYGSQLLCEHHVALYLQLSRHECLHAIQFSCGHCSEICVGHGDGDIRLFVELPCRGAAAVFQVDAEFQVFVAHDELEHCTTHLHKFRT